MTNKKKKQSTIRKPYRLFLSSDELEILVGRSAKENDKLSLKIGKPNDFWLHTAATAGSHVVVRNPENLSKLPKSTLKEAAALAAFHSKSKNGGKVAVHYTQCKNVKKEKGSPAGQVLLRSYKSVQASPDNRLTEEIEEE